MGQGFGRCHASNLDHNSGLPTWMKFCNHSTSHCHSHMGVEALPHSKRLRVLCSPRSLSS